MPALFNIKKDLNKLNMINNLRFELNFKDVDQLEKKLNFCKSKGINNINIPCKGLIKKQFYNSSIEYIKKNYKNFNVVYHYSLYYQYSKNKENSYLEFLNFYKNFNSYKNSEILLLSGSIKKKNYDVISVLNDLKEEKDIQNQIGIAYNPYLNKYFNSPFERERVEQKLSSGLIKSIWIQYGTDIKVLEREMNFLHKEDKNKKLKFYGSLLIPSKQFIARFKLRPWKGVHIADQYLYSLDKFYSYTKELFSFYIDNNIMPVIETDFYSSDKLELIYRLFNS